MRRAAIALAAVLPGAAAGLDLGLPIACTLGEDCYIQQFMDRDPGRGAIDFACGTLSYDGHEGTDFALPTLAAMRRGVDVIAAAPGTVLGVRDEMPDIAWGTDGAPDVTGRECGNGLVIDHGGGWETQYCHLMRGSLAVRPGDRVERGQVLGRVGLSGFTEFPHLHLSVRRDGVELDPFDPDGTMTCGEGPEPSLWAETPPYQPGGIAHAGFAAAVPDYDSVRAGTVPGKIGRSAPALVLYAQFWGGQAGDRVEFRLRGPDGAEILDHGEAIDRTLAIFYRSAGRRAPAAGLAPGRYAGEVRLIRRGAIIDRAEVGLSIP